MPAPYPNNALQRRRPLRRLAPALGALLAVALSVPASAGAASTFYIRGGGDGHGIGLSQYGAYGYALHGKDYRFILGHYYQGTELGSTDPSRRVRVLLATGAASFSQATRAGNTRLDPGTTYEVQASGSSLTIKTTAGRTVGRFPAPLTVSGFGGVTTETVHWTGVAWADPAAPVSLTVYRPGATVVLPEAPSHVAVVEVPEVFHSATTAPWESRT